MYVINGIAYAGNRGEDIEVASVKALDDMMMLLTFTSGETRLFDATVLTGPAFEPLKDPDIFRSPVVEYGVVTWMDGDIDCAPEFMYENSYTYEQDIAI